MEAGNRNVLTNIRAQEEQRKTNALAQYQQTGDPQALAAYDPSVAADVDMRQTKSILDYYGHTLYQVKGHPEIYPMWADTIRNMPGGKKFAGVLPKEYPGDDWFITQKAAERMFLTPLQEDMIRHRRDMEDDSKERLRQGDERIQLLKARIAAGKGSDAELADLKKELVRVQTVVAGLHADLMKKELQGDKTPTTPAQRKTQETLQNQKRFEELYAIDPKGALKRAAEADPDTLEWAYRTGKIKKDEYEEATKPPKKEGFLGMPNLSDIFNKNK